MMPQVPKQEDINEALRGLGFSDTQETTETGCFWRHDKSGRHIQVPKSIDGYFPDWLWHKFWAQALEIAGGGPAEPPIAKPKKKATVKKKANGKGARP